MGTMEVVPMPYAEGDRKICSACRADLPVSEFNRNKKAKDDLNNQCKPCSRASRNRYRQQLGICTIEGCTGRAVGRVRIGALCNTHYRWRQQGKDLSAPIRRRRANGEGNINIQGYRVRMIDGRNVKEHRHVMEQVLGRPLEPFESPHHKNGVRTDNRPENLELWVVNQPKGQRAIDLLAWAEEIVARYGPERDKL